MNRLTSLLQKAMHNKTIVNGSLFSLFSFIGQGISFVLLLIIAKFINPEGYGYLSLYNSAIMFCGIVIAFSTRGYAQITYFKKEYTFFKKDFTAIIILGVFSVLLLSLVVLVAGDWISEKMSLTNNLLWIVIAVSFLTFVFQLQQDYLRIKEKVTQFGVYNCLFSLFNFVLTLLFIIYLNQGWEGRVTAQVVCTFVFGIVSLIYFLRHSLIDVHSSIGTYKEILIWGIPMIPHAASGWIRQGIDQYIINYNYSTYEVGVFSFALNLANIIIIIGTAFNSTNSVTQFQILSDSTLTNSQKREKLNKQMRITSLIYMASSIFVVVSTALLTSLAFPKYVDSIKYVWILSIYALGNCIYFNYCNYLFYYSKTKKLMLITFGSSILHLLLSFLLTGTSLYYTAIIYVISMAVMTIMVAKEANTLLKYNLKEG